MSVPKLAMTVAELREPEEHGLPRLQPRFEVYAPEGLRDRVVHFTALDMAVGDFIAAVETQTGMRHRFRSCGNGWTILWSPTISCRSPSSRRSDRDGGVGETPRTGPPEGGPAQPP